MERAVELAVTLAGRGRFRVRAFSLGARRCRRRARGFTMLEVLIAAFVLALGITGGVAMQLAAMRARHEGAMLAQASWLAAGMAERMRANRAQLSLPDSDNRYLSLDYDAMIDGAPALPAVLCHASACDTTQLAWFDLYEMQAAVRTQLPGGRVLVCRDAALWRGGRLQWPCSAGAGAPLVIKVGWRARRTDGMAQTAGSGAGHVAIDEAPGVALSLGAL